jgi:antitoxin component YwqK of YwqJK toxin-antitoxin module
MDFVQQNILLITLSSQKRKEINGSAWYLDEQCTKSDGETKWFHTNKTLRYIGNYKNGEREGTWLYFHENGMMQDSANYVNGRKKGISLGWNKDGIITDSTNFDGAGTGFETFWYDNGQIRQSGHWIQDTLEHGTWTHYYRDGKIKAKEEYDKGLLKTYQCFDEQGKPRPMADCEGREATFAGGDKQWIKFLQKNLNANVPVDNGAPVGTWTVLIQFIVNEDGSLSDFKTLTKHGYGMEKEVQRLMNVSPKWTNARMQGTPVKAYRLQPVTFQITDE